MSTTMSTSWSSELSLPVSTQRDHIRGRIDAPVTLLEYGDYECPFCALAHREIFEVRDQFGDKLCFAFRHFPLTTVHPHAEQAAEAAEAAGAQRMFWEMHDLLYANQDRLDRATLLSHARALRLDVSRWSEDLDSHVYLPKVREDFISGVRSGVNGTPSFYINGARHEGSWRAPALLTALRSALQG